MGSRATNKNKDLFLLSVRQIICLRVRSRSYKHSSAGPFGKRFHVLCSRCIQRRNQAHVKNADLRHPSCTVCNAKMQIGITHPHCVKICRVVGGGGGRKYSHYSQTSLLIFSNDYYFRLLMVS